MCVYTYDIQTSRILADRVVVHWVKQYRHHYKREVPQKGHEYHGTSWCCLPILVREQVLTQ